MEKRKDMNIFYVMYLVIYFEYTLNYTPIYNLIKIDFLPLLHFFFFY